MKQALALAALVAALSGCVGATNGAYILSRGSYAASQPSPYQQYHQVRCTTSYYGNQAYTTCR